MAILGFLTHTLAGDVQAAEKALAAMPELTTYGVHKDAYVVTVAEAPAEEMEALIDRVRAIEGVLTVYVTSFTREDEELDVPAAASGAFLSARKKRT
jgi:nitrate reductase NapAB chaperone NapD